MGSGVSSLGRLRKMLVIRSYNTREKNQSMEEQFIKYAFERDGKTRLRLEDVKSALSVDAPWVDELFQMLLGTYHDNFEDIEFDHFIEFLETGQYLPVKETWIIKDSSGDPPVVKGHARRLHSFRSKAPMPIAVNHTPSPKLPPTPPGGSSSFSHFGKENSGNVDTTAMPVVGEEGSFASEGSQRVRDMLVPSNGNSDKSERGALIEYEHKKDVKAMWRKSEIVKQERIISYTTVDASGQTQELTEKETTQTEVLHMECRETGEFAHRETTNYLQVETFNNEEVNKETGKEEYVHLKSIDDEFEYMDSTMPQRAQQPEMPDAPQSPRVKAGEEYFPLHSPQQHLPPHPEAYPHAQEVERGFVEREDAENGDGDDLSMKGSISPMQQSPHAFPIGNDGGVSSPGVAPHGFPVGMETASVRSERDEGPLFFNQESPVKENGGINLAAAAAAFEAGQLTEEEMGAIYAQAQAEAAAEMAALQREEELLKMQQQEEAEAFASMRHTQQQRGEQQEEQQQQLSAEVIETDEPTPEQSQAKEEDDEEHDFADID